MAELPRSDRRGPARDVFGKLGISFPYNDAAFPQIVDQWNGSPNAELQAFLTPHPNTSLYPNCFITDVGSAPGENQNTNIRVLFETLPSPWLPFTRYDQLLGPIQGRRRAVKAGTITDGVFTPDPALIASLTATAKTTYEARGNSEIVSWQIEETNSNGSGTGGNPVFPIGIEDLHDEVRGPFQRQTQIVVATGSEVASLTRVSTAVTKIEYQPYNQFLLKKITETWTLPGPARVSKEVNQWGAVNTTTATLVANGSVTPANGLLVISDEAKSADAVEDLHSRTLAASWPTLYDYRWDEETQSWIEFKYETVDEIATAPSAPSPGVEIEVQKINNERSLRITRTLNGSLAPTGRNEVVETDYVFPAILTNIVTNSLEGTNGEIRTAPTPQLRSAFRKKVNLRVAITYHLTEPSIDTVYNLLPNSIYYNGLFFNLSIPQVLNNAFSLTFTSSSTNPQWPLKTETFSQVASTPTATEYVNAINTEKIISSTKKQLPHFQLWRKETAYLTLQ